MMIVVREMLSHSDLLSRPRQTGRLPIRLQGKVKGQSFNTDGFSDALVRAHFCEFLGEGVSVLKTL